MHQMYGSLGGLQVCLICAGLPDSTVGCTIQLQATSRNSEASGLYVMRQEHCCSTDDAAHVQVAS